MRIAGDAGRRIDFLKVVDQSADMNLETIRKRLRNGFRPFVIRTSDGREYRVPHPEFIIITDRVVAVADDDGDVISLDPLHIVGVKDIDKSKRKP